MNIKSREDIKKNLLTKEEIIEKGIEFDGEICHFSDYSDRVVINNEKGEEIPVEGLLYEFHRNGTLAYYCYYKDGFYDRQCVEFYLSGEIKAFCYINQESHYRERYEWYENGTLKHKKIMKYSIILQGTEYDENGNIVYEKKEPTEWEIKYLEKLEKCYGK